LDCFGTTDAISFKQNFLRIHDLKTGQTPASVRQLEIYMALFCLEYDVNPNDIKAELRLYQSDEVIIHEPISEDILYIMDKIIRFDKEIDKIKMGE
jgi:predicted nuclease of restriction endonuclease-like (RecB) superfamily